MLEQLFQLVKENASEAIIQNPEIPNEHNNAAIETTATGIFDILKSQISMGNIKDVFQMISQGASTANGLSPSNPMMGMIMNTVGQQLMSKFGVKGVAANSIVSSLIPIVLQKFASKTADPQDKGFDMDDMMGMLSGGKLEGMDFNGILGQVLGGQKTAEVAPKQDDGFGLDDVFGMMKGLIAK